MLEKLFDIKKVSEDARGEIYELLQKEKLHINFLTIRKGFARGGHSHNYPESFFLISGKIEYHTGFIENEKIKTYHQGEIINTVLGEPHYLLALDNSVFAEFRPNDTVFESKNYEPFRSRVLERMYVHTQNI